MSRFMRDRWRYHNCNVNLCVSSSTIPNTNNFWMEIDTPDKPPECMDHSKIFSCPSHISYLPLIIIERISIHLAIASEKAWETCEEFSSHHSWQNFYWILKQTFLLDSDFLLFSARAVLSIKFSLVFFPRFENTFACRGKVRHECVIFISFAITTFIATNQVKMTQN